MHTRSLHMKNNQLVSFISQPYQKCHWGYKYIYKRIRNIHVCQWSRPEIRYLIHHFWKYKTFLQQSSYHSIWSWLIQLLRKKQSLSSKVLIFWPVPNCSRVFTAFFHWPRKICSIELDVQVWIAPSLAHWMHTDY